MGEEQGEEQGLGHALVPASAGEEVEVAEGQVQAFLYSGTSGPEVEVLAVQVRVHLLRKLWMRRGAQDAVLVAQIAGSLQSAPAAEEGYMNVPLLHASQAALAPALHCLVQELLSGRSCGAPTY